MEVLKQQIPDLAALKQILGRGGNPDLAARKQILDR
jgi:hypothetical protein